MGYKHSVFVVGASSSVLIKFEQTYCGLMSGYRSIADSYSIYSIFGYGVSSIRNTIYSIYNGINSGLTITYSDSDMGFIITNNRTESCTIDIVLWRGGSFSVTTV